MTQKTDELSHALDELNAGRQPQESSKETSELLAVAALLKNAGFPAQPPEHIHEATLQSADAGLKAKKSNRTAWMYSGFVGAAASLLIFFSISGLPHWPEQVQPPPAPAPQKTSLPASFEQKTPPQETPTPPSAPSPAPATSENKELPAVPPSTALPPPVAAESSSSARSAQSAPIAISATPVLLRLPGRSPDSVITEENTGIIRQVYHKGTPLEIIITQRTIPKTDSSVAAQPRMNMTRESGKNVPSAQDAINRVTVIISGQEVTLEGRKTRQELLDMAATLAP